MKRKLNSEEKMEEIKEEQKIKCNICGWEGTEEELESGYYDSHNGSNDCLLCPNCKNDIDGDEAN